MIRKQVDLGRPWHVEVEPNKTRNAAAKFRTVTCANQTIELDAPLSTKH